MTNRLEPSYAQWQRQLDLCSDRLRTAINVCRAAGMEVRIQGVERDITDLGLEFTFTQNTRSQRYKL